MADLVCSIRCFSASVGWSFFYDKHGSSTAIRSVRVQSTIELPAAFDVGQQLDRDFDPPPQAPPQHPTSGRSNEIDQHQCSKSGDVPPVDTDAIATSNLALYMQLSLGLVYDCLGQRPRIPIGVRNWARSGLITRNKLFAKCCECPVVNCGSDIGH